MSDNNNTSGGVGCGTVLLLIFVTLKLTNLIDWSWWWVLSPLWIGIAIGLVFLLIFFMIKGRQ